MSARLLDRVLVAARQLGASDVHLKAGQPPIFRLKGDLRVVKDVPALTSEVLAAFAHELLNEHQRAEFARTLEMDVAHALPDGSRFRVNLFQQRGSVGMVLRLVPPEVPAFETLNLPPAVVKLAEEHRGLVLVTGSTGSGKSTTLAAMIDYVNQRSAAHIVTIEDPIEFVFRDKRSIVNQRELGIDTRSFAQALRSALRQDPDVILVGEMRDLETIEIAMVAAETGHLVLSTLHTIDAHETVNRIVSAFPADQQAQIRLQLAAVLRGVVSQRLVPRADGKGMVPAIELLVNTPRVRELIEDPHRTREIRDAIATGREPYGMCTFDQCLADLVHRKLVTYQEALKHSSSPDDFALVFRGVTASTDTNEGWRGARPSAPASTPASAPASTPAPRSPAAGTTAPGIRNDEIDLLTINRVAKD
ncbi:MAG: type IV pilus twitching motility protein PilT [Myxococcales bacterium]|nr:type IV pilus twitching motility protein PilT [Myxococcales bacterium]